MISTSKRGMCVEYQAVILFTNAGFEVFCNAHPDGPADLVVWDGSTTYLIDTKKCTRYVSKDGSVNYSGNLSNKHPDVYYLGWCDNEWIWLSEPPEALLNVI